MAIEKETPSKSRRDTVLRSVRSILFHMSFIPLWALLGSCHSNPPERNKIDFKDEFHQVADSLGVMMNAMDILFRTHGIQNYIIGVDGTFMIERIELPLVQLNDSVFSLSGTTREERKRLINLILFLKENHISGCFFDGEVLTWVFQYRLMTVVSDIDKRYIVKCSNQAMKRNVGESFEVIEWRDNVALVANQGAKIR